MATNNPDIAGSRAPSSTPSNLENGGDDTRNAPATSKSQTARPECFKSTTQEVLFVVTATMAIAMSAIAVGTVTVITSFVGRDLNMSDAEVSWIAASASLASGSFLLFFGRLSDMFGRATIFLGSFVLFTIFCLGAGFASSSISLLVLNGLMGLCSAASVPPAQGMLSLAYPQPSKRKNAAFAAFSAGNPLGFVLGIISSGIATTLFSWRASFWFLAIVYALFSALAFVTLPRGQDEPGRQKLSLDALRRFDIPGAALTVAGLGLFSAALTLAGDAPQGWKTPYVLVCLILGIVLLIFFLIWENYIVVEPLLPLGGIWHQRDFSLSLTILLLGNLAFPTATFWISLYMQRILRLDALEVAVHLLPMAIMGTLVNVVAGMILHRVSNKLLMGIGATAYVVASILLGLNRMGESYWAFIFPALCLNVIGADFEFNVANMYVLTALPPHQQSMAGGIFQAQTKLMVTVGLGASTAIFEAVAAQPPPAEDSYFGHDPQTYPYAATFWFCAACAAIGVVLVPWLRIGTQGHAGHAGHGVGEGEGVTEKTDGAPSNEAGEDGNRDGTEEVDMRLDRGEEKLESEPGVNGSQEGHGKL